MLKLMSNDTNPLFDRAVWVQPEPDIAVRALNDNAMNEVSTKLCCASNTGLDVNDHVRFVQSGYE
jgi:hypothetical protein